MAYSSFGTQTYLEELKVTLKFTLFAYILHVEWGLLVWGRIGTTQSLFGPLLAHAAISVAV